MPWANTKKNRITSPSFNSSFLARPSRDRKHPGCAASPGLGARCGLLKHRTAIKSTRPLWCHVVRGTMYPMMAKYHCLQLLCSSQPGIQNTRVAAETYYIYLVHILIYQSSYVRIPQHCGMPVPANETMNFLVRYFLLLCYTTRNTLPKVRHITIRDIRIYACSVLIPHDVMEGCNDPQN